MSGLLDDCPDVEAKMAAVLARHPREQRVREMVLTDQQGEFLLELENRMKGKDIRLAAFREVWPEIRNYQGAQIGRQALDACFKRWKEAKKQD